MLQEFRVCVYSYTNIDHLVGISFYLVKSTCCLVLENHAIMNGIADFLQRLIWRICTKD